MAETNNDTSIRNAGAVDIVEVTITTTNGFSQTITPQVIGIEIYEDLFSTFMSGKLMLKDSQELTNLFPLVGEEFVRIHVHTPSMDSKEDYKMEFMIYKMDDRFKTKERELIYVLHFISKEAIIDLNKKVSKGYKGKIHDIVKSIVTDDLLSEKQLFIEETKNTTRFISNFWNPVRCIEWVTDQAVNIDDVPSYLFWETKYGYNFKSLTSLYQGTPIKQRFIWDNYVAENKPTGGSSRSIEKDYQRVIEFDVQTGWNYIDRLKSGMYGSQIIYYDIFTQQYVHKGFAPKWDDKKSLNKYPLWTEKVVSNTRSVLIHDHQYQNAFDDYGDVSNTKTRQYRKSLLAQIEGYKSTISVFGRCDYHAGDRVYLEVPKNTQIKKDSTDYVDELMSGNYLIGAICHFINREKHECTIELIKDSYMREIK